MASEPTGVQRRTAVRVDVGDINAEVWVTRLARGECYPARFVNLSAGGALLMAKESFAAEASVRLRFWLPDPDGSFLSLWARIVRVAPLGPNRHHVAVQFVLKQEGKRDRIARWVFAEMARQRRELEERQERERLNRGRL